MKNKLNRVAISGTSGVGKTTLANYISSKFDLPFVSTSAQSLWYRYGFINHADALRKCLADPELGFRYQKEIVLTRMQTLSLHKEFVVDRGPVDAMAYFLLQQGYYSQANTDEFLSLCLKLEKLIDGTIYLEIPDPSEGYIIEDNGRRIPNLSYQKLVDNTMNMVVSEYSVNITLFSYRSGILNIVKRLPRILSGVYYEKYNH